MAILLALSGAADAAAGAEAPPAGLSRGRLVSHKGESGDAPENTMPAFRLAAERGFGFELDVALSKDGRAFCFHNRDFSRATGGACSKRPAELTWDEISRLDVAAYGRWKDSQFAGTRPALLEEALSLARDGRYVYVHTSGPEMVPAVKAAVAAQSAATPANTLFIADDSETCRAYKREMPGFKVLWVTTSRHWETPGFPPVTADEMLAMLRETGADGVDCHYHPGTATAEAIAAVHAAGREFHVWTIDNPAVAEEALRRGADAITTDYSERIFASLVEAVRSNGPGPSFSFATWNLGHYSCGKTYPSSIPTADMPEAAARYADFLDRANVSVIGTCEDSWFCDAAGTMTARETMFGSYSGAACEQTRPFDYNCLYWTNAVCLATGRTVFPQAADTRFYRWARLRIGLRDVVVVEAHLDWNITPPGHGDDRRLQIRRLIDDFKDEPCVVIGGDFNTSVMLGDGKTEVNTPEDYEAFRKAGYEAAHWGTLATWPSEKPVLTIDNVFAKGLSIDQAQVLTDPALSDHSLLRCRLTFRDAPAPEESEGGRTSAAPKRGVMSPGGDMTEEAFRTLAGWGATLLRFQMVRDWHGVDGNRDLAEYDRWLDGRLDHFDKVVLPLALQYGLRVVLDLHVPPGGRDAGAEGNLFYEPEFAEHFVELWRRIARRFRGRYGIYGYDLLNEPCHKREPAPGCAWAELARCAAEAVREEDPFATIIVEPNLWAGPEAFADLEPLPMDNVVYEVHFYEPFEFTHQRVLGTRPWTEPWPNAEKGWDRAFLETKLKPVRDFQLRTGARILVGEFSAVCWAPEAENWVRDSIGLFEEYGWDWTWHAFREWPGWSVEHEGEDNASLRPSADNPRKRALLDGLRRR